jgi:hypothetical protein
MDEKISVILLLFILEGGINDMPGGTKFLNMDLLITNL